MKSTDQKTGSQWRLLNTPLSDLMAGRITGSGNWKMRLEDAGLPDSVKKAILPFVLARPVRQRGRHAEMAIDWAKTKIATGQDVGEVQNAIKLATDAPDTSDWDFVLDNPLPQPVLNAIKLVMTRSKASRGKRRKVANCLFQQSHMRLQQGVSAETLAAGLSESVALPNLIRQTAGAPDAIDVGMPESIRDSINDVVRRTRLWKKEKADVAGELSAHFQDGLDSGRTTEELIELFGPVKTAASLIRRSRIRCRSLAWQVWRRTWQSVAISACLLIVCGFVMVVRFRNATPNITFDLVAQHDAIASRIPVDDRAWPLYREGMMKLGPTQREAFAELHGENDVISIMHRGPESPDWPKAAEYLKAHRESVDLFLRATERPRFGFIHRSPDNIEWIRWQSGNAEAAEYNPPGTLAAQTLLEHIQELRTVSGFIAGRMFSAAEEGDAATVLRCFTGMLQLGEHARDDGFTVSTLCGLAQVRLASTYISWIVQKRPQLLDDRQLRELNGQLISLSNADWEIDTSADTQMFLDEFLQHAYSPDGRFTPQGLHYLRSFSSGTNADALHQDLSFVLEEEPDGETTPMVQRWVSDLRGSEAAVWIADRASTKRKFEELQAMYQKEFRDPKWTQETSAFSAELSRLNDSWKLRRKYLPILVLCQVGLLDVSYMRQANSNYLAPLRLRAQREAAIVAVALERFRREHDRWPQDLSELKAEYLKTLPVDPLSDQPLRYTLTDAVPHLYSVGPDRVDDGGTSVEAAGWLSESAQGDWLLLPVNLE